MSFKSATSASAVIQLPQPSANAAGCDPIRVDQKIIV